MKNFFANFGDKKSDVLQTQIDDLYSQLAGFEGFDENYDKITDQIKKLQLLQAELKKSSPAWRPSPDAVVGVVGSLAAVLLILKYEEADSVTSKALGFIIKPKN
jgi:hypothetical protein